MLLSDCGALVKFARDCKANYLYVYDDGHWKYHKL
jgi:hypothetical protein